MIATGVCAVGGVHQYLLQIHQRCQIDLRRPDGHSSAYRRIDHPTSNRDYDARRALDLKEAPYRSLLRSLHPDRDAVVRMPSISDFQLVTDMGRMNGRW